jgi:hypothetical protein
MPVELFGLWPAYVLRLAAGILAIQNPSSPISVERATAYAVAAVYHGFRAGVDPYELVGIARNESDFEERQIGPDGKDCGLTQTRVTNSRYTCNQLRRSYWLAFAEASREMAEYRYACRAAPDYDRCRLNRYNSGVRYARTGPHGRYWLRVSCFADAARHQVIPGRACRRVKSQTQIARVVDRGPHLVLDEDLARAALERALPSPGTQPALPLTADSKLAAGAAGPGL